MQKIIRQVVMVLCLLAAPVVAGAQSLVFHHCGGGETVVELPATWSLSGGKIVVSDGSTQVEIAKSEVLTVSYRGAEGDVATIIGLIANGGGEGGNENGEIGHAPAGA